MIGYSLILVFSNLVCIVLGFYFGYLKQHKEEPFRITQAKDLAERLFSLDKEAKQYKEPDKSIEEMKENEFYK